MTNLLNILNNIRFEPMLAHLPLDYSPDESDLDLGYRLGSWCFVLPSLWCCGCRSFVSAPLIHKTDVIRHLRCHIIMSISDTFVEALEWFMIESSADFAPRNQRSSPVHRTSFWGAVEYARTFLTSNNNNHRNCSLKLGNVNGKQSWITVDKG